VPPPPSPSSPEEQVTRRAASEANSPPLRKRTEPIYQRVNASAVRVKSVPSILARGPRVVGFSAGLE
jgi:hypothetical protein